MRYLVTGADGFIGARIHERLSKFFSVIGWDKTFHHRQHLFSRAPAEPTTVIHLGAISSTTETDTRKLADWNILSSCEILEWCVENDVPFVYASSASVYGHGREGFHEEAPLDPLNYYAVSKAAFDMFVAQKIKDNPKAKIYGLRYFNVYGATEGGKGNMASPVYKFIDQAKKTGRIDVFKGSEDFKRDFINIKDVIDITIAAKHFPASGFYNVGTGVPRSFMDVAKIVSSLTGAKINEIPFPEHLIGKYQKFTSSNNTKLLNALNASEHNSNFLTLEQGIAKCFRELE
mgnify:CR=1 FL=1